jgi:hypothetical protein
VKVSKLKSYVFAGLVSMGMLMAAATDVRAAVITGIGTTVTNNATGTLGPVGGTPIAPNNDNTGLPSLNVVPSNHFLFNTLPLDFEFKLANSGGTTEYWFTPSFVNINFTGLNWTQFSFELGFGTGAGFVRSGAGDGLDFDTPNGDPSAFSPMFPAVGHKEDSLFFSGGSVGSIKPAAFFFAIDVPDGLQAYNPYDMNRFTLRITPNGTPAPDPTPVPEPGTMMLIGTGVAALVAKSRKRRA